MRKRWIRTLAAAVVLSLLLAVPSQALTKNTAHRHTVQRTLSAQAAAYYVGRYSVSNLLSQSGTALYDTLGELMYSTITKTYSYSSLPGYWSKTDAQWNSGDAVYFYSDVSCESDDAFSREHVWPKSHGTFYQSGAGSDLHHLRPENNTINTTRNNYTFGNVKGRLTDYRTKALDGKTVLWYSPSYTGNGCDGLVEVADSVKGDVARILLYVYCTYDQPNLFQNTASTGNGNQDSDGKKVIESLDTLLQWCQLDPVDEWEMQRNDLVETLQGNRNVFIDYPELAWLIFGRTIPVMLTPSGIAMENRLYLDVSPDAWYGDAVAYAAKKGYMEGTGQGKFSPNQPLTRGQLVTILYRMEGRPIVFGASPFTDVSKSKWYGDAVIWAYQKRIVKGYPDQRFLPEQSISREQLVTILCRYAGGTGQDLGRLRSYPDGKKVSPYAKNAMCWALEEGLLNGVKTASGDYLMPQDGATRAQFAAILYRWKK